MDDVVFSNAGSDHESCVPPNSHAGKRKSESEGKGKHQNDARRLTSVAAGGGRMERSASPQPPVDALQ